MLLFTFLACVARGQVHICIRGRKSSSPNQLQRPTARWVEQDESKVCLLPARSRKGSCWLLVLLRPMAGRQRAEWQPATERHNSSAWAGRVASCLLRLIPQWNPCTNPIDSPPLLSQLQESLLTTGPPVVDQQRQFLFSIFSFFFSRAA